MSPSISQCQGDQSCQADSYSKLNFQEASRHAEGVAVVAVFLTINDELPNTELEKIGEVLPRI